MMTLREVSPPETITPSSETQTQTQTRTRTHDPSKTKAARRRRLEIQKMRSSGKAWGEAQNGVVNMNSSDEEAEGVTCGSHGVTSIMGRRREMEDAVSVKLGLVEVDSKKFDFFGVYDGHGGSHVAEACRERMHSILVEEIKNDHVSGTWRKVVDWEGVMGRCFERMDKEVGSGGQEKMEEMTVGSTVVMAMVGKEEVVVANCGDSRAILCRNGVAVPLSIDHKPDRSDELARIEAAGGRVINWNGFRVLGVLATSRSIGDHYLKPYVSCKPEVTINKRTDEDEFLILASDGLWDVISNEVACQVVRRCLAGKIHRKSLNGFSQNGRAGIAAAILTELAIAKGSKDNISVIVVELRKSSSRFNC